MASLPRASISSSALCRAATIVTALAGLELALAELGYRAPVPGAGAARAIEVFASG